MIKTVTTLVLGAGASRPYMFPLGAKLRENIITKLGAPHDEPVSGEINDLLGLGHSKEEIATFRDALKWSDTDSVDEFLEHRTEFIRIGKAAIADQLMAAELRDNLIPEQGHWYRHVFKKMNCGSPADFMKNRLQVVTFNYDQSLESFLFEVVRNKFGQSSSTTTELVQSIPIIHVHGTLGPLAWQTENGRVYGNPGRARLDLLKEAAASIKIVHEDVPTEEFIRARELLGQSSRIIFLGFGFHEKNLARLLRDLTLISNVTIGSSFWDIPNIEISEINTRFYALTQKVIQIRGERREDSLTFLQEKVPLD